MSFHDFHNSYVDMENKNPFPKEKPKILNRFIQGNNVKNVGFINAMVLVGSD